MRRCFMAPPSLAYGARRLLASRLPLAATAGHAGQHHRQGDCPQGAQASPWQGAGGFCRSHGHAFTLFERFEAAGEAPGPTGAGRDRATKDWRTDRALRRLEAMLAVADLRLRSSLRATATCSNPSRHRYCSEGLTPTRPPRPCCEHELGAAEIVRNRWRSPASCASIPTCSTPSKRFERVCDKYY